MELAETVVLKEPSDYQDRFRAELYQLESRIRSLRRIVDNSMTGKLVFKPKTPSWLLQQQLDAMIEYQNILSARAQIEGIDLEVEE